MASFGHSNVLALSSQAVGPHRWTEQRSVYFLLSTSCCHLPWVESSFPFCTTCAVSFQMFCESWLWGHNGSPGNPGHKDLRPAESPRMGGTWAGRLLQRLWLKYSGRT